MTVAELISVLETCYQEAQVEVRGDVEAGHIMQLVSEVETQYSESDGIVTIRI